MPGSGLTEKFSVAMKLVPEVMGGRWTCHTTASGGHHEEIGSPEMSWIAAVE